MSFLDDFAKLQQSVPWMPHHSVQNENSPAVDRIHVLKNVYWAFDGGACEDSAYLLFPYKLKDCFDCDFTYESELCYECVDCYKCYACSHTQEGQRLINCHYCYYLRDCQDCFGCVGLQHKRYCIFNDQYTKKKYEQKVASLRTPKIEALIRAFPRPQSEQFKSTDCPYGDHINTSKKSYWMFDCIRMEDCGYSYQSKFGKDSFDIEQSYECELCYECCATGFSYDSSHSMNSLYIRHSHYCVHCEHSEYLFGCINLNNARYCILNKQYDKNTYFKRVAEIKKELGWPTTV